MHGECGDCHTGEVKFETTPILAGGRMFVSTPLNRIIALDPVKGEELWRFDPNVRTDIDRSEGLISRGASYWSDGDETAGVCAERVFLGTIEARLHALDAATGELCRDFGQGGTVRLDLGVGNVQEGQYGLTSPAAIVGDVVVVGSSMGDNRRVDMERGIVRGYDARSGELLWSWDPIPRDASDPMYETWSPEAAAVTGGGNAWAPLSADEERDLVFVPTGSAAPDFYGGQRPGDNRYANSVVALRASTGEVVWHFQVVHHDVWDYDVPAQPSLTTVIRDGVDVPAVVVGTKQGFVFVLHRETGDPLFPVEERAVCTSPDRGNQVGTPYHMVRAMLMGPSGLPCSPPPWSTLVAIDLDTGEKHWEVPFGTVPALVEAAFPDAERLGRLAMGGPVITAGGLVFIGAAMDDYLRAYDIETGEEIWKGALPAGGQATPMTYLVGGKQYVVIAAGGHGTVGTTRGDFVVAFALPD